MANLPHPIDIHVGERIKIRRNELKKSQAELGEILGVSFQQVQKYERGANRVSASRLWLIADALDIPITYFFDEFSTSNVSADIDNEELNYLTQLYKKVASPALRMNIIEMMESVVKTQETLNLQHTTKV